MNRVELEPVDRVQITVLMEVVDLEDTLVGCALRLVAGKEGAWT